MQPQPQSGKPHHPFPFKVRMRMGSFAAPYPIFTPPLPLKGRESRLPCFPIAFLFAFLLIFPNAIHAAPPTEYEVKAAFIHNIAKYVVWPPTPEYGANTMRLCVIGQNPFGSALDTLRNKKVGNLAWEVVPVVPETDMKACRVLFIAASESGNLRQILDGVKGSAVLTIGDTEGYAERGVMANFYMEENMVRIEINIDAARRDGLNISSQLLKLARIVHEPAVMR